MKLWGRCLVVGIAGYLLGVVAAGQTVDEYAYFSDRLTKITEVLHLTNQQRSQVRPVIEQETALLGEIYNNPVVSQEDRLKRYWAIINESESKIKPMLTAGQQTDLANFQKQQKERYEQLMQQAKKKD
jgi:hypothetical protein